MFSRSATSVSVARWIALLKKQLNGGAQYSLALLVARAAAG
jgi:hypothetical protein